MHGRTALVRVGIPTRRFYLNAYTWHGRDCMCRGFRRRAIERPCVSRETTRRSLRINVTVGVDHMNWILCESGLLPRGGHAVHVIVATCRVNISLYSLVDQRP